MVDPLHFDRCAGQYERAWPRYPSVLWQRLEELGLLGPQVRVLELGAGSGQATERLLQTCATVAAVEPGPALAARLRERLPRATVIQDHAEAVSFDDAAFDLVAAATAIHWLDLGAILPKLHRALRRDGHLAVWRNTFGDPLAARTPFRQRLDELLARRTEAPHRPDPGGVDTDYWARRLAAGGWFEKVHTAQFRWPIDLNADQVYDLFSTFSDWTSDEADAAAQIVRDLGGRVTEHYMTPLIVM